MSETDDSSALLSRRAMASTYGTSAPAAAGNHARQPRGAWKTTLAAPPKRGCASRSQGMLSEVGERGARLDVCCSLGCTRRREPRRGRRRRRGGAAPAAPPPRAPPPSPPAAAAPSPGRPPGRSPACQPPPAVQSRQAELNAGHICETNTLARYSAVFQRIPAVNHGHARDAFKHCILATLQKNMYT